MGFRIHTQLLFICTAFGISFAADPSVDENALFADTTTLSQQKGLVDSVHLKDATEQKATAISGDITAAATASELRD
jgi:hypothetical protein